ncbi:exocyst complex component Sec10 [Multifurca ochricompacta]|uniref:Exocyst complex component Sec10 n=1 Tax=Multifurca ochricompacta TaxID=376703 RepID=A0AAD4QR17_9AGAM|nr:exocyst complex component Sec10 [Multifurca ochricompacta]
MDSTTSLNVTTEDALDLRPQTFQGKFDVKDFVGAFSEKLIAQSKADPGPFDPKPFIRTFEAAVDRLIALRKDIQAKTEQMEKSVRVAEREYSKKLSDLNRGFEAVGASFTSMEAKMSEVGRTAGRIGEQLESVHLQRQRAQAAYDLIDYYTQFSRDDTSRIDSLKKEGKEGRRQVAVLLRRLATLAKEIDLPTADKTRENIDRYCEKFEKDMLYLFDRCYRKGDPKMMHHCAQTLLDFNGGASCVQVYVNQHDFFINRVRKNVESGDTTLWRLLADPDTISPKSELSLTELLDEIRATVGQEAQIVQAVFPNPSFVMQVFLQRVFAQSIQQHMEQLLTQAGNMSDLAFLRILQLMHTQTSLLIEDLKNYDVPSATPRSPVQNIGLSRSLAGTSLAPTSGVSSTAISTILETAMEELFVPYTEGQRYLERESKNLAELYSGYLSAFTRYHEREEKLNKTKGSMLDRMMNATGTSGTSSTSKAAAAIMRFGGITSTDRYQDKLLDEQISEEDGSLNVGVAETMLKWHAEAIGRCAELSPDVHKHAFALFRALAEVIAGGYIETAINTAIARIEAVDHTKTEPSLQPLSLLCSVDLICHLWQQYVNTALLPLAASSVVIRREMVVFNNQTVSKVEGSANALMQRLIDAIVSWMATQLAKQKKTDFKPRNDDDSFARVNTDPCVACCDSLEKVGLAAKQNLSGKNLEIFLTEVGVAFHSQLLEHLRKFPVSATGGLMLAKDLKSYQDTIATFSIPALHDRFEFIRQLGNIFLVQPEILKSYITENYLGRIETALLRPYLAQRSDWGHVEKGFSDEAEEVGGRGGTKGLRDRFGMSRLSMMMKDLEGLRIGDSVHMGLPTGFAQSFSITSRAFGRGDTSAS